jgi:hypothetical protein
MSTPTTTGGYVIKLITGKSITRQMRVDDEVLKGIVKALQIDKRAPDAPINKDVSEVESIFVFRGDE